MIGGIGIDLVEVDRIRASLDRFGERFLHRILCPAESAYCGQFRHPAQHVAARFAAKEAVAKAFGTGFGAKLGWLDIEVGHRESGEPTVLLHGTARTLLQERGGQRILLSLSHTAAHAIAVAIIDG
jgi:holo-[acyl-carrier protein] synthase